MEELLLKLKKLDVQIHVENDNLKLNFPESVDETLLLDEIRTNKYELIDYIQKQTNQKVQYKGIPNSTENSALRLTPSQGRLFVLQALVEESNAYNIPFGFEIIGVLDVKRLEDALIQLIQRHESLRTYFILDEKYKPVQKVEENIDFTLQFDSCTKIELDAIIKDFSQPFNLEKAPLLRARLIQTSRNTHVLLADIHHIVSDGLSFQIFLQDLAALYMGISLPELTIQYRDYADWYYSVEYQEFLSNQKLFWLQELGGYSNTAILPGDFLRSNEISFEGEQVNFRINSKRKLIIDDLKKNNEVSLFSVLLSLFGLLQSKLTGVDDLVIGTPVAGRRHDDLKGIIGMFVNTVGIRLNPEPNIGFRDFLEEVSKKTLMCFDHQEYPYEELLEDLGLDRTNEVNPLFNTVITLNNIPKTKSKLKDLDINPYPIKKFTSKFDLTINFTETEDELECSFEYSTHLFKKETIELFVNYFNNIIDQIGRNHNLPLEDVSLLDQETYTELLKLNDFTDVKYPDTMTLVTMFEAQVAKTPENVALKFKNEVITYGELNAKVNQVAQLLKNQGVQRGDIIGLLTGKTFETIIGMLGILKAGGAYLPIDVTYPKKRISYTLENSGTKVLLSLKEFKHLIKYDTIAVVYIEDAITITDVSNPEPVNTSHDLCYVLYTSGTTGNPKGVMIEHHNVVRLLFNDKFQYDFGAEDVWTMFHSHCFDFSVWEMYGAFLNGGKLIIISPDTARDPKKYLAVLQENHVTVLNQTPTAFYNLAGEVKKQGVLLPKIRYVVFGGEVLLPSKLADWHVNHPNAKLINMYGITEITVHITYKEIGTYEIQNGISNIGRPLSAGSTYLFDENLKLVPKGVVGEIYVGGAGVGRGYLNNQSLTNECFIKNPYKEGDRLYKSGDLAVLLDNGELVYKGRSDHQIQLRGFRIELGEIENQLLKHKSIENVIVLAKRDLQDNQQYLCAYFVAKEELSTEILRNFLVESLPFYMIPAYFMQILEIPYTSNNKIAIDKLPEPIITNLSNQTPPVTNDHISMVEIWKEHLLIDQLGITDSFFALGGDSIRAIGLISKINKKFNTSLTIGDIYTYQNIEELCKNLYNLNDYDQSIVSATEYLQNFEDEYRRNGKYKASYEAVYPMNGIEKGMVYHSLKGNGLGRSNNVNDILYHEQLSFKLLIENFSFSIFRKAMHLIIKKHATFRKIYDLEVQAHIILKEIIPEINFVDISHLNEGETLTYLKEKRKEEILNKTGLSFSLLWRISIIKTYSTHYFLFDFHHSLLDGWSLQSFFAELNNIYYQLVENTSFTPNHIKANYYDQILYETASIFNEKSISYWKKEFKGYQRLKLPENNLAHEQKTHLHDLKEFKNSLELVALKHESNLKHLCFGAFVYAMKMLSESNDITVGITTNNRPVTTDGDKLLGCYLNTLPVRIKVPEDATWGQYIDYIEKKLRNFKKHDNTSLYNVIDILGEKTNDQNPIFDVFFNYVDFHVLDGVVEKEVKKGDLDFDNYMITNNQLNMHFNAFGEKLEVWVTYSTSIMGEKFSLRLADYIKNVLSAFIHKETQTVCPIDLKSEEEKNLLASFNNTFESYDLNKTVVDLFKEQVTKSPDKIAVIFGDKSRTYKELDVCSDCWAANLVLKGTRKGNIIGLIMDRSLDMITAILAVMKSGAAYVPIAPNQPSIRTKNIFEECKIQLVISNVANVPKELHPTYICLTPKVLGTNPSTAVELQSPSPEDIAYIIYTSGSTGAPKGVVIQHKNLTNFIQYEKTFLTVDASDRILQFSPYYFDLSVQQIWLPLTTGAQLVLVREELLSQLENFVNYIDQQKVTILSTTPSFLEGLKLPYMKYLKKITLCGEECKPKLAAKYVNDYEFYNEYGPTEATVITIVCKITKEMSERKRLPIGKPIPNTQAYILDEKLRELPIGTTGDLYIAGAGIAQGYLNRPEFTKERFLENPFGSGRLYKTGDLAKWNEDGTMVYMGRSDLQIKLNGVRIEPGEIENQLCDHAIVISCVVSVKEHHEEKVLVAYYTSESDISETELQEHLLDRLPMNMIPRYFVQIKGFPITANGKLDRKALPELKESKKLYIAASNEIEEQLVVIWSEILNVKTESISMDETFFNLGGNSLNALTLTNMILKDFSVEVSLKEVFIKQTIKAIANYILAAKQLQITGEKDIKSVKQII